MNQSKCSHSYYYSSKRSIYVTLQYKYFVLCILLNEQNYYLVKVTSELPLKQCAYIM